jgi:hypothetical protein
VFLRLATVSSLFKTQQQTGRMEMIKFVMSAITIAIITTLKKRLTQINKNLQGEKLYLYESGTQYCVVALINTSTHQVLATFALDALARRDQCLAKAFLKLIERTRSSRLLALSA